MLRQNHPAPSDAPPTAVEPLEPRRLMSASYTLVNFGVNSNHNDTGRSVNDAGQFLATGGTPGLYSLGKRKYGFQAVVGPKHSKPLPGGVNDKGAVVGHLNFGGAADFHAAYWTREATGYLPHDLGTLQGGASAAFAINNAGDAVGWSDVSGAAGSHATLWKYVNGSHVIQDLDAWQNPGDSLVLEVATGISKTGIVAGVATDVSKGTWSSQPFRLTPNGAGGYSFAALPHLNAQQFYSNASGVNASGAVAGDSALSADVSHAVLWDAAGAAHDLGTLGGYSSSAADVNDAGQVVGYSEYNKKSHDWHAFLYTTGKRGKQVMVDLNAITDTGGLTIAYALDVNNHGQIAAYARDGKGHYYAVLLNPVSKGKATTTTTTTTRAPAPVATPFARVGLFTAAERAAASDADERALF